MNNLQNLSDDVLKAELERRVKIAKENNKPKPLTVIDLKPLSEVCRQYIDDLDHNGWADEDYTHFIYETAVETIYGKDIWDWINSVKR